MGAVQTANSPSFESVWAVLDRVGERLDRVGERLDRVGERLDRVGKSQEETDRIVKENAKQQKETDRIVKENAVEIGKLSKRMGEVVEYMVAPNLREKFNELGYNFSQSSQRKDVIDKEHKISFEIDVYLENYSKAMLAEVKTTPTTEDVKDHIRRLEKMRKFADLHGDKRTFLGAVAGVVIKDNVRKYILKQGFFVIEPSGEGFNITSPKGKPKEW
jgi:hypothetical protein